jgi:hypothetical protein
MTTLQMADINDIRREYEANSWSDAFKLLREVQPIHHKPVTRAERRNDRREHNFNYQHYVNRYHLFYNKAINGWMQFTKLREAVLAQIPILRESGWVIQIAVANIMRDHGTLAQWPERVAPDSAEASPNSYPQFDNNFPITVPLVPPEDIDELRRLINEFAALNEELRWGNQHWIASQQLLDQMVRAAHDLQRSMLCFGSTVESFFNAGKMVFGGMATTTTSYPGACELCDAWMDWETTLAEFLHNLQITPSPSTTVTGTDPKWQWSCFCRYAMMVQSRGRPEPKRRSRSPDHV